MYGVLSEDERFLIFFLGVYETFDRKGYLPYDSLADPKKLKTFQLPPYEAQQKPP